MTSAVLLLAAAAAAARILPREPAERRHEEASTGFVQLLSRSEVLRMLAVAFSAFFVFSAIFNYLPFYVSAPPIRAPIRVVTLLYLAYVVGMVAGPLAGKLSNRLGSGPTMALGSVVLAGAVACTLIPSLAIIAASLPALCAGFFGVHAAALGTLKLARMVVGHLAVTGGLALTDNVMQHVIGKGILGRLSARFGEGAVNGIMTARIGLAARDVCRPIPQDRASKETLGSLLRELVGVGDGGAKE